MRDVADAFYKTLLTTQFLPAAEMQAYQRHLLEGLIRHARATTPFYRDSGRLDVLFRADDTIDWSKWSEVPTFDRSEAQTNRDALVAEHVPAQCGKVSSGATSGSTGNPFVHLLTELQFAGESALTERMFSWHEVDRDAGYAKIKNPRGASDYGGAVGETRTNWNLQNSDAPLHQLNIQASVEQQVDWLKRVNPRYLETFANIGGLIAEGLGNRPPGFKLDTFFSIGEILRDHVRERFARLGIRSVDVYSSTEAGILAQQCAQCGALHVAAETCLLELLDDHGNAAATGDAGRVMVTPLYGYAMPLIRYELGDRAIAADPGGSCSIVLPALREIIGRDRRPFVKRDGGRRWPPVRSEHLAQCVDYRQFQIVQTAIGVIEVRVVSDREAPLNDQARLDALMTQWMLEPIKAHVVKVTEILPDARGKIEDVICLVQRSSASSE